MGHGSTAASPQPDTENQEQDAGRKRDDEAGENVAPEAPLVLAPDLSAERLRDGIDLGLAELCKLLERALVAPQFVHELLPIADFSLNCTGVLRGALQAGGEPIHALLKRGLRLGPVAVRDDGSE
jgi:hypothetical protein